MTDRIDYFQEETKREEEVDFHKLYLAELSSVPPLGEGEETALLKALLGGDRKAGKRLVEGKLLAAANLAKRYAGRGVPAGDLVQEANMALLLLAEEYSGGSFEEQMEQRVCAALEDAVAAQEQEERIEEEMAARVNVLKDISASMASGLGREATVAELAERMKMTEEEIKDIMKLTLDALSVSGE